MSWTSRDRFKPPGSKTQTIARSRTADTGAEEGFAFAASEWQQWGARPQHSSALGNVGFGPILTDGAAATLPAGAGHDRPLAMP